MSRKRSFKQNEGCLFLVATPIGNMEDMTFRGIQTLEIADLILAEDTRVTGLLLSHFSIKTPQMSFHEHNARVKIPEIMQRLQAGEKIAQVSDAGMPSISDPGHDLVKEAISANIAVVTIPGASAGISALIASGLAPQPHIFYGFLPRKSGQQKDFFEQKKMYPETQIFYESPHRIQTTLENMLDIYGNRQVVIARELTKVYEEYIRGTISEVIADIRGNDIKGECIILVEGVTETAPKLAANQSAKQFVEELIAQGIKTNAAIKQVAKTYGLNRQDVYKQYHDIT
ncbi:rRNA small subunit methyltransferase I [Streptococcus sp. DD10]|uniref:16S rRNA (cytidine(1402)-2'-O)-methyltransferase n=1 Tax=Streptococcus sp. DD10 TaxID=1777878 RepID=UPI00079628D3|nr:16S rRNA (cytidine(1402)-2'-O)-methyltransferase [Streptococcus sp. DD10]KXT77426.1 rRNA small subunit methyltransferase I [Streptococcus sp. DD10]